jgi:glycosyltransferase involved in cell wall biosynthesis
MRILKIVGHFHPAPVGGAEGQARAIGRELAARGAKVTVLTMARAGAPAEEAFEGMRIVRGLKPIALGPLWGWTYYRQTMAWLRRLAGEYDIIHTHQVYIHTSAAGRLRDELGKPIVATVVCGGEYNDFVRLKRVRRGEKYLAEAMRADRAIAVSEDLRRETIEAGYPAERIALIPYMVDTARFAPPDAPRSETELLFVGRLAAQKNIELLLEAFARALGERPELRLTLVGDGPARASLEARARDLGMSGKVTFEGYHEDVRAWLRRAALSITASRAEGLSNALLEALACGTPIVASTASGNPEIVGEPFEDEARGHRVGACGLLVHENSPDAYAAAILHAMGDGELRHAMSERARARAVERYGVERVIGAHIALYEELLKG